MVSGVLELVVSWWKNRVKGALNDGRKRCDVESAARDVLGRNETVGRLIERVAKRFVGTCIARRDIVNPSIANRDSLGG